MNAPCRSLVAVATSVILALPPGACSVFLRHARADSSAPVKSSCCHKSAPAAPCHPAKAPARPNLKCCCAHDDALPDKPGEPAVTLDLAFDGMMAHLTPRV